MKKLSEPYREAVKLTYKDAKRLPTLCGGYDKLAAAINALINLDLCNCSDAPLPAEEFQILLRLRRRFWYLHSQSLLSRTNAL